MLNKSTVLTKKYISGIGPMDEPYDINVKGNINTPWLIYSSLLFATAELIGMGQYWNFCGPMSEPSTAQKAVPEIAALVSVLMKLNIFTINTRSSCNTKRTTIFCFFSEWSSDEIIVGPAENDQYASIGLGFSEV